MLKHIPRQFLYRSYGTAIISIMVLLASALFSVLTPAANVSADRLTDITNCYNLLNGFNTRDFNTARDPDGKRSLAFKTAPCRDFCKADFTTRAIDCNNPNVSILSPAQIATLKNTYGGPVAEIACKSSPIPEKQTCKNEFINQYVVPCINENVKNASTFIEDMASDAVAGCISARSGLNKSEVKYSLDNARESVTKQQAEEIAKNEEKRKNDCATKGEDYKSGENGQPGNCVPKQATATCQVNGIGWIVCPVVSFMATLVDGAYQGVEALLIVPPLSTETNSPMYVAWSIVRNFANVCFVIAFMFIIISQVSSVGINNYGIKKLLPKLIISAILVNISYWLCAAAVDFSNLIGSSIKPLVETIKLPANPNDLAFNNTLWTKLVGAALAGTALGGLALAGSLSILLPVLIAAVLAIATVFIVLTARHAFIILFIVISPLAFVAYLLPNTEGLFKKWFDAFKVLLFMFPIIAGVFALSRFAGTIVMTSAKDNMFVQIAGAGMTVIPLFITPIVMKAAGGVLSRIGAFVNNPNKGPIDALRKGAGNIREREKNRNRNRFLNTTGSKFNPIGRVQRAWTKRGARIEAIDTAQKSEANRAQTGYIADLAKDDVTFRNKMTSGSGDGSATRVQAQAIRANQKMNREAVDDVVALLENSPPESKIKNALSMLKDANASGDIVSARATAQVLRNSGTKGKDALHDIVKELSDNGSFHHGVEEGIRADGVAAGTKAYDSVLDSWNVSGGKLSAHITPKNMARLNETELAGQSGNRIKEAMAAGAISKEQAASVIKANEQGTVPLDGEKKALLQKIANGESTSTGVSEAITTSGSSSVSTPMPTTSVPQGRDSDQPQSTMPEPITPPTRSTSTDESSGRITHLGRTYEPNENGFLVPRK